MASPHIVIVTYYLMRNYPNCAPGSKNSDEFFFCFGFEEAKGLFNLKGGDADLQVR